MTEAFRALALGSLTLGLALGWLAYSAVRMEVTSPNRLVLELRLAQFSSLLLVLVAGIYVGFAVSYETTPGAGLDIALAIGFFVAGAIATTWEPTHALTALAIAWGAHGFIDLAHIADWLPSAIAPPWYPKACAIFNVTVASICYLPVLRR